MIKNEQPDILQANGSDTLKYAVIAKLFHPNLNIVYRNISMISAWAKAGSAKRKFNQWLFKRVDRVTSVGQQSLEDLVKTYQYPVSKTKLIRRGIPQVSTDANTSRQQIAAEFGFNKQNPLLIHIGQFSPEKNHVFMIGSMQKVLDKVQGAKLVFIGEGKLMEEMKQLVADKKLQANIFFAGHRNQVQELLAAADLFILGSTIEGVPGVILEAGMQAVPSVAVNVGGVGEVVQNRQTGVLVPTHNEDAFADAVIKLLLQPDERSKLGANARTFVMENYSLQNCLLQFEQLYQGIIDEKKCR